MAAQRRLRYGLDAPGPLAGAAIAGISAEAIGLTVFTPAVWVGVALLLYAAFHVWASRVGKVRAARRLLDTRSWRGDETTLDVGCGHGLLLIDAARRLTTGTAVGVDIWRSKDQWHNSAAVTVANARNAGVADRVAVHGADARALPFRDAAFDVVTSSFVIHNLRDADDRARALREIARVLKPDGYLFIIDIAHTAEYALALRAAGLHNVQRSMPLPLPLRNRALTARREGPGR